jgi:uncharacterized protein (TIGR02271 family)
MTSSLNAERLMGRTALDSDGSKIGKVGQVYLDDRTGQPMWVTVSTGLFGTKESFAPLHGATSQGDDVVLAVSKDQVKNAPNVENDGHLDEGEQAAVQDYYAGILGIAGSAITGTPGEAGGPGHDVSGPNTDSAMTRSEERVQVGAQQVETGRARLRKYVVTEDVTQTVPVSHEEVRVEREPITEENIGAATAGPTISEEEHEVTLHAERPVVAKEAVPVERVRMDTETVTEQATVDETVRKERIEVDGEDTGRSKRR